MLVRDERDTSARCLESVRPHIDHWVICDTGSEDDTRDKVRDLLDGVPGRLVEHEWVNSAHNSTLMLQEAKGSADYLLLLHGDMTIENWQLPDMLDRDAYYIPERNTGLILSTLKLIRGDLDWRYEGRCHEHLEADRPFTTGTLDGCMVVHHRDRRSKTTNDGILAALMQDLAEKPTDARTVFYVAQTLAEMGRWREAIDAYRMRLTLPGWDEETFYARYRLGCLLSEHVSYEDGAQELLAAWKMRPHRAEPLRALANAGNSIADNLPIPQDLLFVHTDQYRDFDTLST